MKKTYLNPEATIVTIDFEDILTASGGPLTIIEGIVDGYDDKSSWDSMFPTV